MMKTELTTNSAVWGFNRVSKHSMNRNHIGERSGGFDGIASKVYFDRLKDHRKKGFLQLCILTKLIEFNDKFWSVVEHSMNFNQICESSDGFDGIASKVYFRPIKRSPQYRLLFERFYFVLFSWLHRLRHDQ